jgi:long-chain fatty acid transport protein
MKQNRLLFCAIPALLLILCSGFAWAGAFQLLEQNASGLGNAYAGSAAVAENASTIFFNPAGMTQLQPREFSVGLVAMRPSIKFTNNGSTTPKAFNPGATVLITGNDGGDAGGWNYIPDGYLSWALTKDLYAGVGFGALFGLATEYDSNWYGRYHSIKFTIETYNVNPSIAYRINDNLSLGFGVNWQKMKAEYVRQALPSAQARIDADDSSWGWNAGVLVKLSPFTRIGASYRSSIDYTLEGDISGALNAPAKADLKLPDTFILSVAQTLSDRWELLGDFSWIGWGSVDTINIINKATGNIQQQLLPEFNNSCRVALGTNYKLNDTWKLKFGIAYDKTPVPDAQHRLVSLPDNDRFAFATGAQWKPIKAGALDLGLAYYYLTNSDIHNNQNPTRGIVKGSYDVNAFLLGVQFSLAF